MLLAERDARVVHCPEGNLLDLGFPKTPAMLALGMKVGLGTDGAKRSDPYPFYHMCCSRQHSTAPCRRARSLTRLHYPFSRPSCMPTAGSEGRSDWKNVLGTL